MTPCQQSAYAAGLRDAAALAVLAAAAVEARPDHHEMRQRAVAEALRGLAEGIVGLVGAEAPSTEPSPVHQALAIITDIPGASGEIECPRCTGRVRWVRSSVNGHVSGGCQTKGCLSWMQ